MAALLQNVPADPRENDAASQPRSRTRGELPDTWVSPYIHACHEQSRALVTWPRSNPQDRKYQPANCNSWRHRGPCQDHRFIVDRDRIASALHRYDPEDLCYLVLTFDPKEWDAKGFRPSRALDPYRRARANDAQITRMFEGLYSCWREFWRGKRIGSTNEHTGVRDQLDCNGYVATAEVQRRGWPHINVILVAPGLARRVREETDEVRRRMTTWKRYPDWNPRERRSMLLATVARNVFPTLRSCGFGRASVEAVRDSTRLAAYVAKLAMHEPLAEDERQRSDDGVVISAEFAKVSQVPYRAPPNFRRLRSSRGFLDPLPGGDGTRSGCIVSKRGGLVAGVDYPERVIQSQVLSERLPDDATAIEYGEAAKWFDRESFRGMACIRSYTAGALECVSGPTSATCHIVHALAHMDVLPTGERYDIRTGEILEDASVERAARDVADVDGSRRWQGSDATRQAVVDEQLDATIAKRKTEIAGPAVGAGLRDLLGDEASRRADEQLPDFSAEREAWLADETVLRDDLEWAEEHRADLEHAVEVAEIAEREIAHYSAGHHLDAHARIRKDWIRAEQGELWQRLQTTTGDQREALLLELRFRSSQRLHRPTYTITSRRRGLDAERQARRNCDLAHSYELGWALLAICAPDLFSRVWWAIPPPPAHDESADPRCKWYARIPRDVLAPERPDPADIAGLL